MDNKNYTIIQLNNFQIEYASFLRRLFAYVLDMIFFRLFVTILALYFGVLLSFLKLSVGNNTNLSYIQNLLLSYGLYILYSTLFLSIYSTTPGKHLFNLKIFTEDNNKLNFFSSLIRSLLQPFSMVLFGMGYVRILKDPRRQAWHDRVAKTVVVLSSKPKNILKIIFSYFLFFVFLLVLLAITVLIKNNLF